MMLRVRVELTDVPGALAQLTAGLASLAVDVNAVDVLEVDGRRVVDELLLRLPDGVTAQDVCGALRRAGADVLSSTVDAARSDPFVSAYELIGAALDVAPHSRAMGEVLSKAAYGDAGALVAVDTARRFPLALRALEDGTPVSGAATLAASPLPVPRGWVLWVAPQVARPEHVAVVGRRLNVRFSATEAARLRAVTTLLATRQRAWVEDGPANRR